MPDVNTITYEISVRIDIS